MTATAPARRWRAALLAVLVLLASWAVPDTAVAAPDRSGHERIAEATLFERHNLARTDPAAYGQDPAIAVPAALWSEDVAEVARDWADTMARTGVQTMNPALATQVCCYVAVAQNLGSVAGVPSAVFPDYRSAAARIVELLMGSAMHRPKLLDAASTQVGIGAAIDADGKLWVSIIHRHPDPSAPPGSPTYPHPLPDPPPPLGPTGPQPPEDPDDADAEDGDDPDEAEELPTQDVAPACPPEVPRARFTDVTRSEAERSVSCLVWWGIASGTSPTTFDPHREVRRDQMASFIARALDRSGGRLPAAGGQIYPDVPPTLAHADAVNRLAAAGILSGADGRFRPGESLSRGEMTRTLVRAYEYRTGRPVPAPRRQWFTDVAGTSFAQSINQSAEAGWSAGIGDGTFRPDDGVRRDQMAIFLSRWLGTLVDEGEAAPPRR
jgi:hypothetical protein